MNTTFKILTTLVLAFTLPLLTSWLLDWDWIAAQWSRKTIVLLLMAVEIALAILYLRLLTNQNRKQ